MDLRSRLRRADKLRRSSATAQTPSDPAPGIPLDELLKGEWVETDTGRCLVIRETFSLDHVHGSLPLGALLDLPSGLWSPFLEPGQVLNPRQALFIDTETTGLGRGTSVAFEVGIGYFVDDAFCLVQYFMPDYGDEGALLDLLAEDLERRPGMVSFNGRAFDWPILQSRYILTRRQPPVLSGPHLDLLTMSRRLWRNRLASCSLGSLETHILGLERSDQDVPGFMIPQLYDDYVRHGRSGPMADVIYHNAVDVLSMVTLAAQVGRFLQPPKAAPSDCICDPVALGRLYERVGIAERAIDWYRLAQDCDDAAVGQAADRHLSFVYKRMGLHSEAAAIWERRLGGQEPYPYIELAKHLEHRARDYDRARDVVELAIEQLCVQPGRLGDPDLLAELEHRRRRLMRRQLSARKRAPCTDGDICQS